MDQVYAYPLLRLEDDDQPLEQVLKIFIALRELWNTRNTLNHNLLCDALDGCRFGLKTIQELLGQPGYQVSSKITSEEVNQKILNALSSTDASKQMAEFMRWATDSYMGFLKDCSKYTNYQAKSALTKLEKVKKPLLANTSKVDQYILDNNSQDAIDSRNASMIEILNSVFRALVKHHRRVSDSRIGIEELLRLAEEPDFVNRLAKPHVTIHVMFAKNTRERLPMGHSVEGMALTIRNQIEERGHPMAIEYAIKTVAPVVSRLSRNVLAALPYHEWVPKFQEVGLEQIGKQLAADIGRELPSQQPVVTPSPDQVLSAYTAAPTHRPSSVVSISSQAIREELEDPSDDSQSLVSHRTSLFGSKQQTPIPQNTQDPSLKQPAKRPMQLALPPAPRDQKNVHDGTDTAQAADAPAVKRPRTLPPSKARPSAIMSDQGPRKAPAGKSMMQRANDMRVPGSRRRAPPDVEVSRVTPSCTDNGSESTSGSTSTARIESWQSDVQSTAVSNRKRAQQEHSTAGLENSAGETIGRLRYSRPLKLKAEANTALRPVARVTDEQLRRQADGIESQVDSDEDVEMDDGADGTSDSDQEDGEDLEDESESESEIESSEEE